MDTPATEAACRPPMSGGEFRRVYRLDLRGGPTGVGGAAGNRRAVVVDVETTGLDRKRDVIIELAMRQFLFDDAGRITNIGRPFCWLQDPSRPLTEEIMKLTGLDDAMLKDQSIDKALATGILQRADLVIAHNASFDRPRVEDELPEAAGRAWCCSCVEIAWRDFGFDGRSLGYLLSQAGYYNGAHRASDDVDSTIALLAREVAPGRTALADLVERSSRDSWMCRVVGAAFERKDDLKARGYRWDADNRVWHRELADRDEEETWLMANIYQSGARPTSAGPEWRQISARERWA
ncbi:3'-5' exonuclease [Novosphingobium rosa]|jgi:DNA polymerase-3 subunit epsilon|uniref:3'-5' exonuclease n=1 Tax=Novosphingobium rosa TaxID=76978 RepID=UPI000832A23A|nr:3'-5' exonuclease [Novosphingobium rosa]